MTWCPGCENDLDENDFAWRNKTKGIRLRLCRRCQSGYKKKHYENNKQDYRLKNEFRRQDLAEIVSKIKDNPCQDCGYKFHPVAMDFDHRDDKMMNVSRMVHNGWSIENIRKEIEKCDLVCSNCHRIRTFFRNLAPSSNGQDTALSRP